NSYERLICRLFEGYSGLRDQLAPQGEVVAVDLEEPLGRGALGGVAVALQLLQHFWALERRVHFLAQPLDDWARQLRRAEHTGPLAHGDLRHAGLGDGRHVGSE